MGRKRVRSRLWWGIEGSSPGVPHFVRRTSWEVDLNVPEEFAPEPVEPWSISTEAGDTPDPLPKD